MYSNKAIAGYSAELGEGFAYRASWESRQVEVRALKISMEACVLETRTRIYGELGIVRDWHCVTPDGDGQAWVEDMIKVDVSPKGADRWIHFSKLGPHSFIVTKPWPEPHACERCGAYVYDIFTDRRRLVDAAPVLAPIRGMFQLDWDGRLFGGGGLRMKPITLSSPDDRQASSLINSAGRRDSAWYRYHNCEEP